MTTRTTRTADQAAERTEGGREASNQRGNWLRDFLRAALYSALFLITFGLGSGSAELSGLSVYILRATGVRFHTYYDAARAVTTVNGVLGLGFAIIFVVAVWSIRNPGNLRLKFDRAKERVERASGVGLVVLWVTAVFTIVGYPVAIYGSWHYAKRRLAQSATPASTDDLASRLARLDSAREAGIITRQEHAEKRAALIQAW